MHGLDQRPHARGGVAEAAGEVALFFAADRGRASARRAPREATLAIALQSAPGSASHARNPARDRWHAGSAFATRRRARSRRHVDHSPSSEVSADTLQTKRSDDLRNAKRLRIMAPERVRCPMTFDG
jgi:hypothetical protein